MPTCGTFNTSLQMRDSNCSFEVVATVAPAPLISPEGVGSAFLSIFPAAFFDTDWQAQTRFVAFRRTRSTPNLYDGAFAWHWHNQWDAAIEDGSKFQLMEQHIDQRLAARGLFDRAAVARHRG